MPRKYLVFHSVGVQSAGPLDVANLLQPSCPCLIIVYRDLLWDNEQVSSSFFLQQGAQLLPSPVFPFQPFHEPRAPSFQLNEYIVRFTSDSQE